MCGGVVIEDSTKETPRIANSTFTSYTKELIQGEEK